MNRGPLRDDLALAAYALALGFEVQGYQNVKLDSPGGIGLFDADGIPGDGLQFIIGDMHVWLAASGWRCCRLMPTDNVFEKPGLTFPKLKAALDEGARNWRDR